MGSGKASTKNESRKTKNEKYFTHSVIQILIPTRLVRPSFNHRITQTSNLLPSGVRVCLASALTSSRHAQKAETQNDNTHQKITTHTTKHYAKHRHRPHQLPKSWRWSLAQIVKTITVGSGEFKRHFKLTYLRKMLIPRQAVVTPRRAAREKWGWGLKSLLRQILLPFWWASRHWYHQARWTIQYGPRWFRKRQCLQ